MIVHTYGIETAERILRAIGTKRVVFGTDWIGISDKRMTETLNMIDDMKFSDEEKALILGENINELLEAVG